MRGRLALLAVAVLASALLVSSAGATLSPAEQAWIAPLVKVWNLQNSSLKVVIAQALKPNALVAGEKPDNLNLTNTLVALADCKQPKDRIKLAGKPPTARLNTFVTALDAACSDNEQGAEAFTKAMVAYTADKGTLTKQLLTQGVADFKKGTAELTAAYKAITNLGGKKLFTA